MNGSDDFLQFYIFIKVEINFVIDDEYHVRLLIVLDRPDLLQLGIRVPPYP